MIFTLHRYIFRELFRVFVLATLALTLMMSLGSILRPVQKYGVGPEQVIHLIGYFLPIILTFVIPMAALFAAALVYGRFAADNEIDACRASGISLMTLVYPGLALAIIVTITNLILSFYVTPAFVQRQQKSLKADTKQIIFRNIQRKGYYRAPNGEYLIYADNADFDTSILSGVIISEIRAGHIAKITTAQSAKVQFNPHKRFNEIQVDLYDVYQMEQGGGDSFSTEWISISKEFGSLMGDDIRFKKIDKMKQIAANPMEFYPIEKLARGVYARFTAELLAEDIKSHFDNKPNTFYKLRSGETFVAFKAERCSVLKDLQIELSGQVDVIDPIRRTFRCTKAILYIEGDELAPTLTMELYNAKWKRQDGLEVLSRRRFLYGLLLPGKTVPEQAVLGTKGLKNMEQLKDTVILKSIQKESISSALPDGPTRELTALQTGLTTAIDKMLVKIKAETHSRLVFGIGCLPVILIGIGLGILKKEGHLLSAFGVSAIPAGVLTVSIMMGTNVAKNTGASQVVSGIALMWAGLVLLCMLTLIIYHKLLKN